uniref:DUF6824 domain-containing protein n=1 Tax=Ditylum brightwellii TaxID=49249 RepID=A0A7S4RYW7_9STRA
MDMEESHQCDAQETFHLKEFPPSDLNENDVLCGRGAATNNRTGNRRFRTLIEHFRYVYMSAIRKEDKTEISRAIVDAVRNASPPGRFLKKHATKDVWCEIGDRKAWEKTSQTLRDLHDKATQKESDSQHSNASASCPTDYVNDVADSSEAVRATVDPLPHTVNTVEENDTSVKNANKVVEESIVKKEEADDQAAENKPVFQTSLFTKQRVLAEKKSAKLCNIPMQIINHHEQKSKTSRIIDKKEKTAIRKNTNASSLTSQTTTKRYKVDDNADQQVSSNGPDMVGTLAHVHLKNEKQARDPTWTTVIETSSKMKLCTNQISEHREMTNVAHTSGMEGQVDRSKEGIMNLTSRGRQPSELKSTDIETGKLDLPMWASGTQTNTGLHIRGTEQNHSSDMSLDRLAQSLNGQYDFQALQTTMSQARKDAENHNGSFSSECQSLMQELSKWTKRPTNSTVKSLQAHLYGYPFYQEENQSTCMSNLIGNISDENNIPRLKVVHLAASNILSQSNLNDSDSDCSKKSTNCSTQHEN